MKRDPMDDFMTRPMKRDSVNEFMTRLSKKDVDLAPVGGFEDELEQDDHLLMRRNNGLDNFFTRPMRQDMSDFLTRPMKRGDESVEKMYRTGTGMRGSKEILLLHT